MDSIDRLTTSKLNVARLKTSCLTVSVYRNVQAAENFSDRQWDEFIRQARQAKVLARLALMLRSSEVWSCVPGVAKLHLESAIVSAAALKRTVVWEINQISHALQKNKVPCVYLKGVAYHLAQLPAGDGRIYNDIDFMVPKKNIQEIEHRLNLYGWKSTMESKYDQTYYRRWMHEIPPLKHVSRGSVIDLHHAILPETAALKPDSQLLLATTETVVFAETQYLVLSPVDMVLHSATHLFHDGELEHGLRDLMDLDSLFSHFGNKEGFWDSIVKRSVKLQLSLPLYYAVTHCKAILSSQIPDAIVESLHAMYGHRMHNRLMGYLFKYALMPDHKSCRRAATALSRLLLYIRAHYLRMPLRLLIPHLFHKAFIKG
ncbi:MAG: nucleotidyltransferase family protein [Thiohalomonadales bacterium]